MKHLTIRLLIAVLAGGSTAQHAAAAPQITVLSEFSQRPGNPATGPDGTIYFTMHPFDNPEFKVLRLAVCRS